MGIFASLMTWLWYNWNEDRKEKNALTTREKQINRLRAQLGYVPLEVETDLRDLLVYDREALVDYIAGTLDRDSKEWIETNTRYRREGSVMIDGRSYTGLDHLLYDYAMKRYKVKIAPLLDPLISSSAKYN